MAQATPVGEFLSRLYPLVCEASEKYSGKYSKGRTFEDKTAEQIYSVARELGFHPYPPRLTLELPTVSGNRHQFDASFQREDTYYLVECKNTKTAAKDYLYYFYSKILDYVYASGDGSQFKAIFVCAVEVPDSAWRYSIAYGVRVLDPISPPLEYMIKTSEKHPKLQKAMSNYLEKIQSISLNNWDLLDSDPDRLLDEYRYFCTRWREL